MDITGIDYRKDTAFILYGKVNPFKKDINLLKNPPKNATTVVSIPAALSTFRIYEFPVKDPEKIKNLVKGQLQFDIPIPFEQIDYSYYISGNGKVFCVITKKDIINEILEKYENVSIIDSEIFSLIRLLNQKGEKNGKIIHFFKDQSVFIEIEDNFPVNIQILGNNYKEFLDSTVYISGEYPEELASHDRILNFGVKPVENVAYGNILRGINPIGVDFLHKDRVNITSIFFKVLITLILVFLVIDGALFLNNLFLQKQINEVKAKQKEIYLKYFSPSGPVFDPLMQAKGLISRAKSSQQEKESLLDVLDKISAAKLKSGIEEIYRINIEKDRFIIQGIGKSLKDIEKFKNELSKYYKVSIEESVVNAEGKVRFKIKGEK